uniref:Small ribosomal subunit protein uS12m n=1 Tax=Timema monikensis TaxID=170555 RepID=A0A7R9E6C2_9NEOP|nr:unnamed protein product [Timema monikensis]
MIALLSTPTVFAPSKLRVFPMGHYSMVIGTPMLSLGFPQTQQIFGMASLAQMHRSGPHFKTRPPRQPLGGKPFAKGVVLKTLIKKPKKPNSANRKCVLVRLSTGKEMVAYVPGIGHNLQEHNIVLCRVGRSQDLPGKHDNIQVLKSGV